MFVLSFNGSPRRKGNTEYLLSLFMDEAKQKGFETKVINAASESYEPCIGCGHCEKKGFCSIKDSMEADIFPLIRKADLIVLASPVYFYSVPAKIKAIIDRTQTLWSRKYRFDLKDPGADHRKGLLLSVGATKGKNLFDGIKLTARYFFDAVSADFTDSLCYPRVDQRGELEALSGVLEDVKRLSDGLLTPLKDRKRILFACRENAGRSQMAAGFFRHMAGGRFDVLSGGSKPGDKINSLAVEAMGQKGIDIAFQTPASIEDALGSQGADIIVTMGCGETCPVVPGCRVIDWDMPDPAGKPIEEVIKIRDEIKKRVEELIKSF